MQRQRLGTWTAVVGISLAAGASTVPPSMKAAPIGVVLLIALVSLAAAAWSLVVFGDWLNPVLLSTFAIVVLYCLRPVAIENVGSWGPGAARNESPLDERAEQALRDSLFLALIWIVAFTGAFIVSAFHTGQLMGRRLGVGAPIALAFNLRRYQLATAIAGAVAALGVAYMVYASGGIRPYIDGLSVRTDLFYGRGFLLLTALPLRVFVLLGIFLVAHRTKRNQLSRWRFAMPVTLLAVADVLSGGRSALLLGTVLPMVLIINYRHRRFGVVAVTVLAVLSAVFFLGSRVALRDSAYTPGPSRSQAVTQSLGSYRSSTVSGPDARPLDNLMRLVLDRDEATPQYGRTYLPILTFPVPRVLWVNKPLGGGNAWFTRRFYPSYFGMTRTETSISYIGESFANFRVSGVIIGAIVLACFLSITYTRLMTRSPGRGLFVYCLCVPYVISLIRGDAFQNVTRLALTVLVAVLAWNFVETRPKE